LLLEKYLKLRTYSLTIFCKTMLHVQINTFSNYHLNLMTFDKFKASLAQAAPPVGLSKPLQALWYDGKGDWHQSHEIAQIENTPVHCLLHAYLHRKEGDIWNANYWYNRAGRKMPKESLDQEWENIARELLVG
jgi:hypothetical protein